MSEEFRKQLKKIVKDVTYVFAMSEPLQKEDLESLIRVQQETYDKLLSLFSQTVKEQKPKNPHEGMMGAYDDGYNAAIKLFEANLLKVVGGGE